MSDAVVVIQARTGSGRLPGKVMYPLDGDPVLSHVIERVNSASVGIAVVATSEKPRDDVIAECAPDFGAEVLRGSELNVLERYNRAIERYDPTFVLRVTADCPLVSSDYLRFALDAVENGADYAGSGMDRTFPRGVTAEAFTSESFAVAYENSSEPRHREHVTPYFRENPDTFDLYNVVSSDIFDDPKYQNRTDLRLTLDEAADYLLLREVFRRCAGDAPVSVERAVDCIDERGLATLNNHVSQKAV